MSFAAGLFVSIGVPNLVFLMSIGSLKIPTTNLNSSFGAAVAILCGGWLSRNLTDFPGIEGRFYSIPSAFFGFAFTAMFLLFFRIDYSVAIFFSSFALFGVWQLVTTLQREPDLRIGLVPIGSVGRLHRIAGVTWVELSDSGGDHPPVDAIAADLHGDIPESWERRMTDYALTGMPVYHFKQLVESLTGRVEVEHLSENSFGSLGPGTVYMQIKGASDRITALFALLIAVPVIFIIAIVIRVESQGPAIFRQQRMGYRSHPFTVYKFRTMRERGVDEKTALHDAMTRPDDDRITPLGAWLRRTRLDELPQLLNIVRGEMSWIGPRPEAMVLSLWYEQQIPYYRYRHIVPPGLTGWAQVMQGHVTSVDDVQEKLNYDFFYIKHFSPWLDLLILLKTVTIVVTGHGAR